MKKDLPLRFCSNCVHDVRDDGKGKMRPCGKSKRWICAECIAKTKAHKATLAKPLRKPLTGKPGRKQKPRYDDVRESAAETREFIRQVLGI
jgi:hypothetical protein